MESSEIREEEALTRLYTVIAMATLFLVSQGVEVVKKGIRREVDPHWKRGLSYLKIGLRYVASAYSRGYRFITEMKLCSKEDPEPVKSSKKLSSHARIDAFKTETDIYCQLIQ